MARKLARARTQQQIRNGQKRELYAVQKAGLAVAEVKVLQTQIRELTTSLEAGPQDAARTAEVLQKKGTGTTFREYGGPPYQVCRRSRRRLGTRSDTNFSYQSWGSHNEGSSRIPPGCTSTRC
jgi:hypothetical protein